MNKNNFAPAFPTVPIQDKLGQIIVNFGLNKLEVITAIIAAQISATEEGQKVLPETIAQDAAGIAAAILDETERLFNEANKQPVIHGA